MSAPQASPKGFVSVTEMAEICQLSRSRFYTLMEAGVFPRPALHPSSKRPMYDLQLQRKCLEIRQTGIGADGRPVLFNRKPRRIARARPARKPAREKTCHSELLDALKGLGLATTEQAVAEASATLFPTGYAGLDLGDVVRQVFLHLQGRQS